MDEELADRVRVLEQQLDQMRGAEIVAATANLPFLAAIVAALVKHNQISVLHVEGALGAQRRLIESLRATGEDVGLEVAAHEDLEAKLRVALSWYEIELAGAERWEARPQPSDPSRDPAND